MSQYLHIFVNKDNMFIPIKWSGRSGAMYEMLEHYAPYEKIAQVTAGELHDVYSTYEREVHKWTDHIAQLHKDIELIASFGNSVDDKLEAINDKKDAIEESENILRELQRALAQLDLLIDIAEDSIAGVRIYVGIACGDNVTINDVEP